MRAVFKDIRHMKILVTGGVGFIGSHLCESLLKQDHEVIAIDNFDPFYPREIKEDNLQILKNFQNFKFFEEDLCNDEAVENILAQTKPEVVVHLAAKAGVRPSLKDPQAYVRANIEATVSLMEAMRKAECKKLVFASSSSVYGKTKNIPFEEEEPFEHAISVYAATKQAGENMTRMYHNLYELDVINLRFFTVYGPRQRPDLAIHKFLKANLTEQEFTLFGDGSMARDYTFVADTVGGIEGSIKRITENNSLYEIYNLGNSTPVSLKELTSAIEETTGIQNKVTHQEVPPGDVPITFANISKAEKFLNYRPQTPLAEGLKVFAEWIKERL